MAGKPFCLAAALEENLEDIRLAAANATRAFLAGCTCEDQRLCLALDTPPPEREIMCVCARACVCVGVYLYVGWVGWMPDSNSTTRTRGYSGGILDTVASDLWEDVEGERITSVVGGAQGTGYTIERLCAAHENGVCALRRSNLHSGPSLSRTYTDDTTH